MPKLDLSKAAILTNEERARFKNAQAILEDVKAEAENLGLIPYPRPSNAPPSLADEDITTMPNDRLGHLYAQYTAHAQFVYGELAQIKVAYRLGLASLKLIEAKMKSKMFAQEVPKGEVPARVREDPQRVEYELEILRLFAMREILEAHYMAYDHQAAALSRIIELRKLEFQQHVRGTGIENIRKGKRPERDFRRE